MLQLLFAPSCSPFSVTRAMMLDEMFLSTLVATQCYMEDSNYHRVMVRQQRKCQIDPPASTPWISHSIGENNVAPKSLEHLINFLQKKCAMQNQMNHLVYTSNCFH